MAGRGGVKEDEAGGEGNMRNIMLSFPEKEWWVETRVMCMVSKAYMCLHGLKALRCSRLQVIVKMKSHLLGIYQLASGPNCVCGPPCHVYVASCCRCPTRHSKERSPASPRHLLNFRCYVHCRGVVSTDNSGGFASVRCKNFTPLLDLSPYEGIRMRLKGNGQRFKMIIRTDTNWDGIGYCK
jgi:hypothetical protein